MRCWCSSEAPRNCTCIHLRRRNQARAHLRRRGRVVGIALSMGLRPFPTCCVPQFVVGEGRTGTGTRGGGAQKAVACGAVDAEAPKSVAISVAVRVEQVGERKSLRRACRRDAQPVAGSHKAQRVCLQGGGSSNSRRTDITIGEASPSAMNDCISDAADGLVFVTLNATAASIVRKSGRRLFRTKCETTPRLVCRRVVRVPSSTDTSRCASSLLVPS